MVLHTQHAQRGSPNSSGAQRRRGTILLAGILLLLASLHTSSAEEREIYRIRIANAEHGPISVSADGGETYRQVGKVTRPATTAVQGYLASIYASPGTVAAVAVHAIRIKTSGARESSRANSRVFSILPREFASAPRGFGGHVAASSGICTDIPTGTAIFRNLAPFVGNPILRLARGKLIPLGEGYSPAEGDILVIVVSVPARCPKEIVLENRAGGLVQAFYSDGKETIARVAQPVRGVGRFDATGYTGVGRINTSHTGVLTISTAPIAKGTQDGSPAETRGGFMIQPSRHARTTSHKAQVLVAAPLSDDDPWLEGSPPLFSGCIGLASDPNSKDNSFRVDVRASDSDWMPLPALTGKHDDALMSMPNGAGRVTHIRIRFPELPAEWVKAHLQQCSRTYLHARRAEAQKAGTLVMHGELTLQLGTTDRRNVWLVSLYIDGQFRGASNIPPYMFSLHTEGLAEGDHIAELQAIDLQGRELRRVKKVFFVQGQSVPARGTSEGR